MQETGSISIHTENIFPIIKRFLYSDHEIFLRELVSNAVDATQKLKALASIGEFNGEIGETKISISLDEEAKTITVSDRGIGMTAEDIKKYINQIAFSGATEFLEKYKDKDLNNSKDQLIGHFGLGFYSAFMVSEKVRIVTLSHKEGAQAAEWECDGSTEFKISPAQRADRGTDIVLHISEESKEFLDKGRIRGILTKYCKFLPVEIEFDGKKVNNPAPIWTKTPADLKDEDYLSFYKELYPEAYEDPLFWIHLNVDYPFNLTGVLYFPKIRNEFVPSKDKIQLYSRQVFITEEVKDIVPEFLTLLRGVIDSPDIPLNVSRSFLQADGNVKKINSYITKKVGDKLNDLFKADRKAFEEKWENINLFAKFGMITDEKFYEKAIKFALLDSLDGKKSTLEEYKELVRVNQTDKNSQIIFLYTNEPVKHHSFIESAKKRSYDVLKMEGVLDSHFINHVEKSDKDIRWQRVDAEIIDKLVDKGEAAASILSEDEKTKLQDIFKSLVGENTLSIESLPVDELPVLITMPEFMRRMKEMAKTSGMGSFMNENPYFNVSINANHSLISKILKADEQTQTRLAKQAYDLAKLSQSLLSGADLTAFVNRSVDLMAAE
ncbi:MAG: molecular chaperone HtpG [Bacteroidetes bacterium]|nr:MAG: molecular chaperone HtpG [Bacteroidota bacterium]